MQWLMTLKKSVVLLGGASGGYETTLSDTCEFVDSSWKMVQNIGSGPTACAAIVHSGKVQSFLVEEVMLVIMIRMVRPGNGIENSGH